MSRTLPPPVGEPPTKVIFDGVEPGSPEARALFLANQGEIQHFHAKARQNRAISEQPSTHMQQALPGGGQLRYSYNNGLETIHVKLTPRQLEAVEHRAAETTRWDTALIEIVVPDMTKTGAVFSAFAQGKTPDERGVARDDHGGVELAADSYMHYPSSGGETLNSAPAGVVVSSLKVDLTGRRGTLKVDIYGYIEVYYVPGEDGPITGSRLAAVTGREKLGYLAGAGTLFPQLGVPAVSVADDDWALVQATFPEIADYKRVAYSELYSSYISGFWTYKAWRQLDDTFVENWETVDSYGISPTLIFSQFAPPFDAAYTAGDTTGIDDGIDAWWDGANTIPKYHISYGSAYKSTSATDWIVTASVPDPAPNDTYNYICASLGSYYLPTRDTTDVPEFISRTAQVSAAVFRGDPLDADSEFVTPGIPNDCFRWEGSAVYPSRWRLGDIGTVTISTLIPPEDVSEENHFGMPRLGTATIDIDHGSVKWESA